MSQIYFGVDIGGTTIKMGSFSEEGQMLDKWEIPTRNGENGRYIFDDISASVKEKAKEMGRELTEIGGIGIGFPSPILPGGHIPVCANIEMEDVYLAREISMRLGGVPALCENDANVAALGEARVGGGKGHDNMVMLTLGTGVGGGVIVDGKIVNGIHGAGGEIGHLPVNLKETATCGCGGHGCLEQYASATGLVRIAKKLLAENPEGSRLAGIRKLTAKDVLDAAKEGDPIGEGAADIMCEYLAQAMACISLTVDPEVFVLGGGVAAAGSYLIDKIRPRYKDMTPIMTGRADIALASLGNTAGIWGAYYLVRG